MGIKEEDRQFHVFTRSKQNTSNMYDVLAGRKGRVNYGTTYWREGQAELELE